MRTGILLAALLAALPNLNAQDSAASKNLEITSLVDWYGTKLAGDHRVHPERRQVQALLDHPLRDPSICKGPDQWYYLTGTDGTPILPEYGEVDFKNNDGIRVWRSKDLENWEFVTQALDLSLDAVLESGKRGHWWSGLDKWRLRTQADPDEPGGVMQRGVQAPEIHYFKDTFWIVYSISGVGGGLLKSVTGKAEGPYVDWAVTQDAKERNTPRLFYDNGSPSLFHDDDPSTGSGQGGAVYLLYGAGSIAKLKEDMTALAEGPRPLFCHNPKRTGDQAKDYPIHVGKDGFFLKKLKGRYYLFATDTTTRGGELVKDVYVAWSDNIYGPYSERRWCIPYADQTTVFEGPDGQLLATYCGDDAHAAFCDRAGVVPLGWTRADIFHEWEPEDEFPRRLLAVNTERFLWHRLPPVTEKSLRDTQACRGPDGAVYYTGTHMFNDTDGKLYIWKSMDMINWEPIEVWNWDKMKEHLPPECPDPRTVKKPKGISYMGTEVWHLNDTFFIGFVPWVKGNNKGFLLRSASGKAEGPYTVVADEGVGACVTFFQDDDGAVYECNNSNIQRWKKDMSGPDRTWNRPNKALSADGTCNMADCAGQIAKIHGKYVNFTCGVEGVLARARAYSQPGAYSRHYMTADSLEGPWSREQVIGNYVGHGGLVQDGHGNWWSCSFANEASQGQPCLKNITAYIYPCTMEMKNGQLRIRMADTLPDYAEKALREWEAKQPNK